MCALKQDLDMLPAGDQTEIGEKVEVDEKSQLVLCRQYALLSLLKIMTNCTPYYVVTI